MALRSLGAAGVLIALALPSAARAQCEVARFVAPDAAAGDLFGIAADLSGDVAVVGSEFDDDAAMSSGSAYVYERAGGAWALAAKLTASDADFDDRFGFAVAASGDRVAVTSRYNADLGYGTGSVYVFERQASGWVETAKLLPDDAGPNKLFGTSVSLDGDRMLVGASADTHAVSQAGSAYLFEHDGTSWQQVAKLVASDPGTGDRYGDRTALSGDVAVVASFADDDLGSASGSAYVYERQGTQWVQTQKLLASDGQADDRLGVALAIDGERIFVGATANVVGTASGAVYVFRRQGSTWAQTTKLVPSDATSMQLFGAAIDADGGQVLVGAWRDNLLGTFAGSAYVFEREPAGWVQRARLTGDAVDADDQFGFAVALEGATALVGARGDDAQGFGTGAAYLFSLGGLEAAAISACPGEVFLAEGGEQQIDVSPGAAFAGQVYLVLGSFTGATPGIALGGGLTLPLNADPYLEYTLLHPNAAPLAASLGVLDAAGTGQARFTLPPNAPASLAGLLLRHAYAVIDPLTLKPTFVSPPAPLRLDP